MKHRFHTLFILAAFALIAWVLQSHEPRMQAQAIGAPAWSIYHVPAVNTQATISKAAVTGKFHIADCILGVLAAGTAAPTAVNPVLQLRDGATGVGTVLWSATLGLPATAGLLSPPVQLCGLNIAGTPATAMTLEFAAAGGANTFESVLLKGRTQ